LIIAVKHLKKWCRTEVSLGEDFIEKVHLNGLGSGSGHAVNLQQFAAGKKNQD
jgi:hypothetical protein